MIAASLLYVFMISLLLAIAALAAEQIQDLFGLPKRFVWLAAMGLMLALSAARIISARSALPVPVRDTVRFAARTIPSSARIAARRASTELVSGTVIIEDSAPLRTRMAIARLRREKNRVLAWLEPYESLFAWSWAVLTALGAMFLVGSLLRVRRGRPSWVPHVIERTRVMLTKDLGPAVVGLSTYEIVVPAWVLDLSPDQRQLIVTHEREHARAHDPRVLFGAFALATLMPWNLPLWFMVLRLRDAIELDCDARVLQIDRAEPEAYGSLLLDVSERAVHATMPIAALAEPAALLGRRIDALVVATRRHVLARTLALTAATLSLAVLACVTPAPQPAPTPPNKGVVGGPRVGVVVRDSVRVASARPHAPPSDSVIADLVRRIAALKTQLDSIRSDSVRRHPPFASSQAAFDSLTRKLLANERTLHPDAFAEHGDSANLVVVLADSRGTILRDTTMVLVAPIDRLMAGQPGNGSVEIDARKSGQAFTFGQIFPYAPDGKFILAGLSKLSDNPGAPVHGTLAYEIIARP